MLRQPTLAVVVVLCACLAACGGGTGIANQTPSSGSGTNGGLFFTQLALDFGNVPVGTEKTASVTVTNTSSSKSVTVTQIDVTGSTFTLGSSLSVPFTLSAGQSATINAGFSPTNAAPSSGNLVVVNNSSNSQVTIGLSGTGTPSSGLTVSPSSLSFGDVVVGGYVALEGTLTASANSVTVTAADWTGSGFSMSGVNFPLTISAGQSVPFTVSFDPTAAGAVSGDVMFTTSFGAVEESLSGIGTVSSGSKVSLSWNASSSPVVGYNVYRSIVAGGPYADKLTASPDPATNFVDSNVQSATTYYYVSTAVDSSGHESSFSNAATAVIP